jgi:hypothetical protein
MRARVEMQGFLRLSDPEIEDLYYWLRVAPLVSGLWTSIGVLTSSPAILWGLVPILLTGAAIGRHPADAVYTLVVRPRRGTAPIPTNGAPRRFACATVAASLAAAGACFFSGATIAGRVLGGAAIAVMAVDAITGYCVPSAIYNAGRSVFLSSKGPTIPS